MRRALAFPSAARVTAARAAGGERARLASFVAEPRGRDPFLETLPRKRSQFDPRPNKERTEPRFQLPGAGAADTNLAAEAQSRSAQIRLDAVLPEHVEQAWPPAALVEKPKRQEPVKRPRSWLVHPKAIDQDQCVPSRPEVGVEDIGRFVPMRRDDLIELLPEGGCGDLAKDLTLVPSREKPVGLMLRKLSVELMHQMSTMQDATDARGRPRIDKAGYLLDGHRGTGKSQILNLLAMWARERGWLVVLEPNPSRYSREIAEIKRSNNGVYIQNEFAQQFLEVTSLSNRSMLESIPVDFTSYGSRAIDGEPMSETRRLYEPLIEKTVDREADDQGLSGVERLRRIAEYKKQVRIPTMVEHLRDPATVWDIVDFGLENEAYATQAVAEMFVQLQRQTVHPVLVLVDEWNECFPCSEYVSVRYDNTRFHGQIPAYHLTMPRAFHRWDGHLYRRGIKICATSWMKSRRRDYRPELLSVKDHQIRTVRNFSPVEFANYVMHLRASGVLHNFPANDLEYYFMLTGGNGWQARRILSTLY